MSLRARLAIGMAVLAAAAAITATGVAYAATSGRLSAQVDQSLRQAAAQIASMPGSMRPFASPGSGGMPMTAGHGPAGILGLVSIQYLDPAGNVTVRGQVPLPVQARDRSLARSGGTPWLHDSAAGNVTYRVLTQPLQGGGAVQLARDETDNQAVLGSLRWLFGLLDAAVVIAAAVAGWFFTRGLTRPLRQLADAADQVAATGSLDIPVDAKATDETGRVARSFATMLGALSRSRAQQHQLAQDAAHELRTPLTSLRANVDILRRHGELPAQTRTRILGALDTELRELTGLVDELVELSTDYWAGHGEQAVRPVRLDQLVSDVASRSRQRSGRTITVQTEPCVVLGQPRALARAVANLVDNALKFSPDPSPIEITVQAGRVQVRDHGPGIAPADLPRIFDRFYRSAAARSQPGSGLGLAIVAHVAESSGGHAFARNLPDGGAVAGIDLPCQSSPSAPTTAGTGSGNTTGS